MGADVFRFQKEKGLGFDRIDGRLLQSTYSTLVSQTYERDGARRRSSTGQGLRGQARVGLIMAIHHRWPKPHTLS